MSKDLLCPFSKPILGNFCQCRHALAVDRCAGKMSCGGDADALAACHRLVAILKERGRFLVGSATTDGMFTHAQLMKLRCGALRGMQRILAPAAEGERADPPVILELIALAERRFGSLEGFPYSDIAPDIAAFSHRRRAGDARGQG